MTHTLQDIHNSQAGGKPGRTRTGREGKSLETLVKISTAGVRLLKIPQSARRLPTGKIIACRGPVDFLGLHKPSGRMLIFDAKQTGEEKRIGVNKTQLAEHQRLEIIAFGRDGAIAGLLCEQTTRRELYWCPWQMLRLRKPSILWADLYAIGSSSRPVDWGQVLRASECAEAESTNGAAKAPAQCTCIMCLRAREGTGITTTENTRMIVCPICGNKRCPHASDHRNNCTGSNDSGQKGSIWENVMQAKRGETK